MTLPSAQYFSNAIVGQMQVGADVNLYRQDTAPKYAVGQGFTRGDGNEYRYASFGAAVTQGKLVAPTFADSGKSTQDNKIILPASAVQVAAEAPIYPGQIGSHYVQVTLASITAGQFQGGYFITEDGTGEGYTYRIRGNTATGNPATGDIYLQLWEPLEALVGPNTDIQIIPSMYNSLSVASAATDFAPCGATVVSMASGEFGWICTHGVHAVLEDITVGTLSSGDQVALSTAVSGAIVPYGQGTTDVTALTTAPIVGYCIQTAADTEYAAIYLQLE